MTNKEIDEVVDEQHNKDDEAISIAIQESKKFIDDMFWELKSQFGEILVSQMDSSRIDEIMANVAESAAQSVMSYCINQRYKDSMQSTTNMMNGILAGIHLGKKEGKNFDIST